MLSEGADRQGRITLQPAGHERDLQAASMNEPLPYLVGSRVVLACGATLVLKQNQRLVTPDHTDPTP